MRFLAALLLLSRPGCPHAALLQGQSVPRRPRQTSLQYTWWPQLALSLICMVVLYRIAPPPPHLSRYMQYGRKPRLLTMQLVKKLRATAELL